ncbi:MAG TPA: dihydrodipicolinate reductase C-terminal domain-containing protein, partial [Elusimicrobiota bacterium]|nr:dihydrodipicolinate reductase C-terminal domain-containing protein [Elusimicrobiota bacterium]
MTIPLAVLGADGRMGREICALARRDSRLSLAGEIRRETSSVEFARILKGIRCLVDFSRPDASIRAASRAASRNVRLVIGTTGFSPSQTASLKRLSRRTAVLISANMSPGMNVLFDLAERAARALPGFDAAISETHHRRKKDAPSGTALSLAESVRRGRPGGAPAPIVSLRAGDVPGDHELLLAGPGERIVL